MAVEIAPVLDTFGVGVAAVFVRDTAFADRPALIIKADNSRRQLGKSLFGFCIKGDEWDDVPMIHEFIGGIVVHGPIVFFASEISPLLQNFFPRHRWGIFM